MKSANIKLGLAVLATVATTVRAGTYSVPAAAANLTTITQDGLCNLTEAIQSSHQGPVNSDCSPSAGSDRIVSLAAANTTYKLAAGTSIWTDMTLTTSQAGVVVESDGTAFNIVDGCVFRLSGPAGRFTLRVKSGVAARLVRSQGGIVATRVVFRGGDISGLAGDDALGGVIFNWGQLDLTDCLVQNGKALDGGGIYNRTPWVTLQKVTVQDNQATRSGGGIYNEHPLDKIIARRTFIQNNTAGRRGGGVFNGGSFELYNSVVKGNKAGQGGGIFHQKPGSGGQPELRIEKVTVQDNKAIATELTPTGAGPTITGSGAACSAGESATQAFDDSFATKWCNNAAAAPTSGSPATLTYAFPAGTSKVVSAYSLTSANDVPGRDPRSWKVEGYNGTSWVTLQTVTNFTFSSPVSSTRHVTESFNSDMHPDLKGHFNNTTAYSGYRIVITANAGNVNITQLAEVQFYGAGQTGDGGGLYNIGHQYQSNNTYSRNIAGCVNASCACSDNFCAATTNTSIAMGKGGAFYAGNPPPEGMNRFITVAANSASQGGGVYADHWENWGWFWSLIGRNTARTNRSPEPDFHGVLCAASFFPSHENLVQNTSGTNGFSSGDVVGQDPLLGELKDNGGEYPEIKPWTHALQTGSPAKDMVVTNSESGLADERGVTRPKGVRPDLGAFELE